MNRMSQLLTKHEYAINSLKQDSTVYFFVKPGPQGCCRISSTPQRNWRSGTRQRGPPSASLIFLPDFILQCLCWTWTMTLHHFLQGGCSWPLQQHRRPRDSIADCWSYGVLHIPSLHRPLEWICLKLEVLLNRYRCQRLLPSDCGRRNKLHVGALV